MAVPFKARYFLFYNFINALIPRAPVAESAISALKVANAMGLIGLFLWSDDGRVYGRVWDEVRLLLHSPVEDGEEDEWLTDLEEIPEVPPNSPVDLTPSTSNESSGGSRPKTVPYPISTFDLSQKRENQN